MEGFLIYLLSIYVIVQMSVSSDQKLKGILDDASELSWETIKTTISLRIIYSLDKITWNMDDDENSANSITHKI